MLFWIISQTPVSLCRGPYKPRVRCSPAAPHARRWCMMWRWRDGFAVRWRWWMVVWGHRSRSKKIKISRTCTFYKYQKSKRFFCKSRIILLRKTHRKARKDSREEEENTNQLWRWHHRYQVDKQMLWTISGEITKLILWMI